MLGDNLEKGCYRHMINDDACVNRIRISSRMVQFLSVAMVVMTLCYIVYGNNVIESTDSTNVIFIHMLCLAAQFGAQCWVTLVAGFTMVFNLPRIMFGRFQCMMLPVYFGTMLMLSCVTLVTYVLRYDYDSLNQTQTKQLSLLVVCVICTFINSCFLAPSIVDFILSMFEMKKGSGIAYTIEYCDKTELKKSPEYCPSYRKCKLVYSVAGVVNTVAIMGNVLYIHSLASRAANMDMISGVLR